MRAPFITVEACRACGAPLEDLHAFGETPLADRLMRPGSGAPDYLAPLTLAHCPSCALCQIRETVEPRVLFGADYPYYSSVSPALIRHFRASAEGLIERLGLGPGSFVVEPASNDGAFLAAFAEAGIDVLGVDPADGPAAAANARGVPTRAEFFTRALAERVAAEGRRADLIAAHNVLAHVADTHDFAGGIAALLAE
ncbi:MAG: methyltransferase, partial [Pseudomonadota bacterium]